MAKPSRSKSAVSTREQSHVDALAAHLPMASIPIDGQAFQSEELQQLYQLHVDAVKRVDELTNARAEAIAAEARLRVSPALTRHFRDHIAAVFGEHSKTFLSFGFKPHKKRTQSVESKAAAQDKRAATLAAQEASTHAAPAEEPHSGNGIGHSGSNGESTVTRT